MREVLADVARDTGYKERGTADMTPEQENAHTPVEELSFKQAQEELESIVRSLESGTLELEDSLALYERGVALLRSLKTRLEAAEQKIDVLMGELEPETE